MTIKTCHPNITISGFGRMMDALAKFQGVDKNLNFTIIRQTGVRVEEAQITLLADTIADQAWLAGYCSAMGLRNILEPDPIFKQEAPVSSGDRFDEQI
jgi:hypothetical protein